MQLARYVLWVLPAVAFSIPIQAAPPYFTTTPFPNQRQFIENINLSAGDFLNAYRSKEQHERRYAELYLMGVLDSTEGTLWCSYRKFKTDTISETLYEGFENLKDGKRQERASKIIAEILAGKYPCTEGQR